VSNEPWKHLAAGFAAAELDWRITDISAEGSEAQVRPQLRYEAVLQRLDETLGLTGWSSRYSALGDAVACELTIGTVYKSALAESTHVNKSTASKDAFVYAAELFGMVPPVNRNETYLVDYDAEAKAVLFEPDVSAMLDGSSLGQGEQGQGEQGQSEQGQPERVWGPTSSAPSASVQAATDTPVKSAGQQAIDKLVERLEQEGKGKDVAKLIIKYGGYGQDPEAARELYSKLRTLLVAESS
jgi:hypothetical protein